MKRSFDIIYEDRYMLAVYKKGGLLTIGTERDPRHCLYHYVREYLNGKKQRVFVVHRLDKDTSGIVLFAKDIDTKEYLQSFFEEGTVDRYYECVVKERLPLDKDYEIVQYLCFDERSGMVYETRDRSKGKRAVTLFHTNSYSKHGTVLDIKILTGRRNQIRLALQKLQLTLIGDKKYSGDGNKTMLLNEYEIVFPPECDIRQKSFFCEPKWLKNEEQNSSKPKQL
ncbi:MAG: RluA family pseudouridine synthase [Bacilli bacterium]